MIEMDTELLYLARGEQDVLVEKCPKRQDVIDGIRFLYKQYVKKKPGVILNEPERCSSIIQTVLFVSSVRLLLDRPTLVLCDEGLEQKWLDHFVTWTNMAHDVTADTTNPFTQKVSVYITPITEMGKFYSRDWSVIVVDSDTIHKEILRDKLSTRFKIWITCDDVKENLNVFSQLYKWLHPKQAFDANLFKSNQNDPYDAYTKEIMLDSFMEDVVFKRNNISVNNNFTASKTPPKIITRKNKDATGTKIKRTKRKNRILSSEDNSPNKLNKTAVSIYNIEQNSFNVCEEISNISITRNLTTNVSDNTMNNYIIHMESDEEITSRNDRNVSDNTINNYIIHMESDDEITSGNQQMSKTRNDSSIEIGIEADNNQIDKNEITKIQNKCNEAKEKFAAEIDEKYKHNNDISIQNDSSKEPDIFRAENNQIGKNSSIESDDNNSTNLLLQFDEESTPLIIDETKSNDSDYDKDTQMNELDNVQYFNAINTNINEMENKINDVKTNFNEIDKNDVQNKQESENLFSTESISDLNKINNKDELNEVVNVKNNKTESIDSSSVEYKMKQIEELAMKKFKGSFLDSLF